jgi:glycine cleavage system H protein
MSFPDELLYTKEHEWARKLDSGAIQVGITTFAVEQLGDVTVVELPEVGDPLTAEQVFGTVESVKAVSELYAPISGTVTKVNTALADTPELVNDSPYEDGWMVEIELADPGQLDGLLDAGAYAALVADDQ